MAQAGAATLTRVGRARHQIRLIAAKSFRAPSKFPSPEHQIAQWRHPRNQPSNQRTEMIMNSRRTFIAALFSAALSCSAFAQTAVDTSALVGKWKGTEQHPSGAMLVTTIQLNQNHQFTTSTVVNGNPVMSGSGTWKVSGKNLEWRYESSSTPAIPKGYVDTDEVANVGSSELTLVSKLSGKTHVFQRFE